MRIAHVVTYISPDGAFGGPVRVALGQAAALAEQGHNVTVFAASPDNTPQTIDTDGYQIRTFPARRIHRGLGFAGMFAPGLTKSLRRDLAQLDIVHVHLARDLVTLPAARAARKSNVRLIVQPHGMIDRSQNPLAAPIDAWEVKSALAEAHAVLTLTDRESRDIQQIAPTARVERIANGIRIADLPSYDERAGGVVFLARLHQRKRPGAFVEMAAKLVHRGVAADFILAGPDEGEADQVLALIRASEADKRIRWIGPVDPSETDALLREARVFVLPSIGEVFPMSILEAFAAGTPVVTTSSLGIASKCRDYGAAVVTDGTVDALSDAVSEILSSSHLSSELRAGARRFLEAELSIDAVADHLVKLYEE